MSGRSTASSSAATACVIEWRADGRSGVDYGGHRHHANLEMVAQIDVIALGRGAFEEMVPTWSTSDSAMARILNALPKVVFAHGGSGVDWNAARATDAPLKDEILGSCASRARTSWPSAARSSRTA